MTVRTLNEARDFFLSNSLAAVTCERGDLRKVCTAFTSAQDFYNQRDQVEYLDIPLDFIELALKNDESDLTPEQVDQFNEKLGEVAGSYRMARALRIPRNSVVKVISPELESRYTLRLRYKD